MSQLSTFYPAPITAADLGLGAGSNATFGSVTTGAGTFTTLAANNGTLTASAPVLDLAQTWNASGVTFTGMRFNVTNTASATASNIAEFQVGGTSMVNITRDGFIGNANAGMSVRSTGSFNRLSFTSQGAVRLMHNNSILLNEGDGGYGWVASGAPTSLSFDTGIFRGGAGIIEQRNAANPQTFRLYNTFTDASNHERGFMRWSSNVLQIGTEKAGTGSARALEFQTDGTTRVSLSAAGGAATFSTNITMNVAGGSIVSSDGLIRCGSIRSFEFGTRSRMTSPADGQIRLTNTAETDFSLLQFGGTTSSFPALKRSSTALQVRLADDSAFAPFACAGLTLNGDLTASTRNIVTDTTTGTKIGTGTTQKIGFFDKTPVVQPTAVADATDAATVITQLNALLSRMRDLGLIAT